ncbi:MAG: hypothetical protein ACPGYY_10165 [Bacteroidia bacterium]
MKNIKIYLTILLAFGVLTFSACSDDSADPAPDTTDDNTEEKYNYETHAAPILNNYCATSGCHVSGATIGSLEGYADAKAFAQYGRIMGTLNHEEGFSPMPKNQAKLSDVVISTIQKWIDDGLLEK